MQHFFKKSLGQHFLVNKSILKKIVSIKDIRDKIILEIGPGQGALTKEILQNKPKKLILIEKDRNLRSNLLKLQEKFKDTILSLGGSFSPLEVFKLFRGREPKTDSLIRHLGLSEVT